MPITRGYLRITPPDSAYYVVMHSCWRKKRGKKNSSCSYGGITNPDIAIALAAVLFEKLVYIDNVVDAGRDFLCDGRTYHDTVGDELGAMIRCVTEECNNPKVLLASLTGMIEIPHHAIDLLAFSESGESYAEYLVWLEQVSSESVGLDKKLLEAAHKGMTPGMLLEMQRAHGGLVTKDGTIAHLQLRDRYGALLSL